MSFVIDAVPIYSVGYEEGTCNWMNYCYDSMFLVVNMVYIIIEINKTTEDINVYKSSLT